MIPYEQSRVLVDHKLSPEERSVRGTLVTGLSEMDIEELDEFEGTEYIRRVVNIHPLAPLIKLSEYATDEEALISPKQPSLPAPEVAPVKAETYVFVLFERLGSELWSFEDFIKNHAWKWYSEQPLDGDVRWAEVDEEDKKAGKN
ncbi:hypothetical protein C0991_010627 [Blastosporella zonata]|nr:hypothetical protein C0991_010627 [Blastosporella zonata]